ncbi:helix-turn-helix transcriptional regulator [Fodinisporobacter ferrooxydans]|uniref:Helix-turn-helix transcriptional regulator n=1 Tax=Fodinisporobacter ferrooxydans TaxID=2901836 RepID=A0ABY4CEH5_9BACL|nr:helix-turn-helix transcriptional regulator [Alicyclobacillaceae bacterium MYW30-H2]
MNIELSARQQKIIDIVRMNGPITGEQIAEQLHLTRATLRPDLSILTMAGFLEARPRVGYYYAGKKTEQIFGDEIRKYLVKDYKSVPVVIEEQTSVYDAIVTMFLEDVGSLFVVKGEGTLVGIVSRKDLLKVAIGQRESKDVPVTLAMTRMPNLIYVELEDSLYQAAKKLIDFQIDTLPVVKVLRDSKELKVVGRITKTTITKVFVELGTNREI